jgi:hypothetical protein
MSTYPIAAVRLSRSLLVTVLSIPFSNRREASSKHFRQAIFCIDAGSCYKLLYILGQISELVKQLAEELSLYLALFPLPLMGSLPRFSWR